MSDHDSGAVNYLDLFSGIGGFALGAHRAGMRFAAHYFSEVDPWAVELYQKRFPDAIPLGDIRGIDGKALADTARADGESRTGRRGIRKSDTPRAGWVLTGGFPCQDISFAGKGAGLSGARSGLWWEYHRLIDELRPRYAIVENVAALYVRGLDVILGSLAELGFDAEWDCIKASDVGAPHRRARIWIVAYPEEFTERAGLRTDEPGRQRRRRPGDSGGTVPDTDCERWGERRDEHPGATDPDRQQQGATDTGDYWAVEPNVGRLAHGVPHRVDRLRGLGNAIVPQIAELIFRQIQEAGDV